MTREEVAKKIRWSFIFWVFGFINVAAMLPQLVKILETGDVKDLSIEMFVVYLAIQVAFCLDGFFKRNPVFMWCMGLSAVVSTVIISLILHYRP